MDEITALPARDAELHGVLEEIRYFPGGMREAKIRALNVHIGL